MKTSSWDIKWKKRPNLLLPLWQQEKKKNPLTHCILKKWLQQYHSSHILPYYDLDTPLIERAENHASPPETGWPCDWQKRYNVTSKGRWSKVMVSIWSSWDTCLWSPQHHVRCPRLSCRWYRGQYRFPHYSPSWDSWQQSDSIPRFMSEDFPFRWFLSPAVEISQPLVLFSWHYREEGVSCHHSFLFPILEP